jgi:hypothetical protein
MIKGRAVKVYEMTTDAPDDKALIRFANSLAEDANGMGLDSLDLGDTLGFFVSHLESGNWETALDGTILPNPDATADNMLVAPEGFTVTISYRWENFQWEGTEGMKGYYNEEEL